MSEANVFWDPLSDNILQERDETGVVTAEYTTEPGLYGNLISQSRGGVKSQYHFDALGSTFALTDDSQEVTDTYAYTAFGEMTEQTGSTSNSFQYVGREGYYEDKVTSRYSIRRRPLSSKQGRWLARDAAPGFDSSIAEKQLKPYSQSFSNPVNVTEPSGLQAVKLQDKSSPPAGRACEVRLVCWPAFRDLIPIPHPVQHCEYRIKPSLSSSYYKCRCGGRPCDKWTDYWRCADPTYFPVPRRDRTGYYPIPIPRGVPACLGCDWTEVGKDPTIGYGTGGGVESVAWHPLSVCRCLETACTSLPRTQCYKFFFSNSTTGAACVARKCKFTITLPKTLGVVPGIGDASCCPAGYLGPNPPDYQPFPIFD